MIFVKVIDSLKALDNRIGAFDAVITRRAKEAVARRLVMITGIGPSTATALSSLSPPPKSLQPTATSLPG